MKDYNFRIGSIQYPQRGVQLSETNSGSVEYTTVYGRSAYSQHLPTAVGHLQLPTAHKLWQLLTNYNNTADTQLAAFPVSTAQITDGESILLGL